MRIGVDFDDVLYPYHHYLRRRLRDRFGIDLTQTRPSTFYYELLPEFRARGISREQVWDVVRTTWFETEDHAKAPLLDSDAEAVLRRLGRRHRIVLVTARHGDAAELLGAFLKRHRILHHEIVLDAHEKSGFDVLVDDFPSHAVENAEAGGHSLLYTIDENRTFDESRHPRIQRVESWRQVEEAIQHLEAKGA